MWSLIISTMYLPLQEETLKEEVGEVEEREEQRMPTYTPTPLAPLYVPTPIGNLSLV